MARWFKEAEEKCKNDVCNVLVATKCDLEDERMIDTGIGERCARNYGMGFFETSAKTAENVEDVFLELTAVIMKKAIENTKKNDDERNDQQTKTEKSIELQTAKSDSDKKNKCGAC